MNALHAEVIHDILGITSATAVRQGQLDGSDRTLSAVFKSSVLGEELDAIECELLAAIMEVGHLGSGERLVTEGDVDSRLVLVAAGEVAVMSRKDGNETSVYTMTQGECAGTRAFVDGTPRKATLQAVGSATVYTLKPEDLEAVIELNPVMAYRVMRGLFRATHNNLMRVSQERQQLTNYITKTGGRY